MTTERSEKILLDYKSERNVTKHCLNRACAVVDPGEGPGVAGPPLSLDQTEVQRAEKNFFETTPPNLSQGLDDPPPPLLSEGLDPPLMRSTVLRSKVVSR